MVAFVHQGGKPPMCPRCGRQRRIWRALAWCRWPRACWIVGKGPLALLAWCGELTITLWPLAERDRAEQAKQAIDNLACGGRCRREAGHEFARLDLWDGGR